MRRSIIDSFTANFSRNSFRAAGAQWHGAQTTPPSRRCYYSATDYSDWFMSWQ